MLRNTLDMLLLRREPSLSPHCQACQLASLSLSFLQPFPPQKKLNNEGGRGPISLSLPVELLYDRVCIHGCCTAAVELVLLKLLFKIKAFNQKRRKLIGCQAVHVVSNSWKINTSVKGSVAHHLRAKFNPNQAFEGMHPQSKQESNLPP